MYQFTANDTDEFSLRVVGNSFGYSMEHENMYTYTVNQSSVSNSMVSFTARDTLNAISLLNPQICVHVKKLHIGWRIKQAILNLLNCICHQGTYYCQ